MFIYIKWINEINLIYFSSRNLLFSVILIVSIIFYFLILNIKMKKRKFIKKFQDILL